MDPAAASGGWTAIGGYCERTSAAFWAEPLNALSNLAFVATAVVAWVWTLRAGRRDPGLDLLIGITAAIGVGSFLFHTLATPWAALADVLPILLFIIVYLVLICRRWFGLGWRWSLALGLAYLPVSLGARLVWRTVAGGTGALGAYLPALAALLGCALLLARRRHPASPWLAAAAALFALSLAFRSLDLPLCAAVPMGTHFLWHLLNGILLAFLLRAMLSYGVPAAAARTIGGQRTV